MTCIIKMGTIKEWKMTGKENGDALFRAYPRLWLRQESNLDLELRQLLYYPLYYEANICLSGAKITVFFTFSIKSQYCFGTFLRQWQ